MVHYMASKLDFTLYKSSKEVSVGLFLVYFSPELPSFFFDDLVKVILGSNSNPLDYRR